MDMVPLVKLAGLNGQCAVFPPLTRIRMILTNARENIFSSTLETRQ
jgi:hypothetical protein